VQLNAVDTEIRYHQIIRGRHRNTLEAIFADPVRANLPWLDVEALFVAAGASISEGRGSRGRVSLNGVDAVFHRPHPRRKPIRERSGRCGGFCARREWCHDDDDP
jgi:hypothetical protein